MAHPGNSYLSNILLSERKDKKKPFRKAVIFTDGNWANQTTITLASSANGFTGPTALLISKYRAFQNFSSGVAVIHTVRPRLSGRDKEREFESICVMDLDGFLATFAESQAFSEALEKRAIEVVREWWADNSQKDKAGVRVPIERSYRLSQHTWRGRKKQEYSQTDLQLSSWGYNQKNLHVEIPTKMTLGDVKALMKLRTTSGVDVTPDTSSLIEGAFRYDG
jgi:hypothetical protein